MCVCEETWTLLPTLPTFPRFPQFPLKPETYSFLPSALLIQLIYNIILA